MFLCFHFWLLSWKNNDLCLLWSFQMLSMVLALHCLFVRSYHKCGQVLSLSVQVSLTNDKADWFDSPFADPFDSSSADWLTPASSFLSQVIVPRHYSPGTKLHYLCILVPPFLPPAEAQKTKPGDTQGVDHTKVSSYHILTKTWYILYSLKHCIALKRPCQPVLRLLLHSLSGHAKK